MPGVARASRRRQHAQRPPRPRLRGAARFAPARLPAALRRPDRADDWSVADWCDQCHRKRGLVVWTHLLPRLTEFAPQGEALAALLLGKIDAFEVSRLDDPEPDVLADWYRLLDCGLRVPLVGGSGKDSNAIALGAVRTYARLADGQPFGYAAWVDAVKAGRTFVTNGPLLNFTADGFGPGATLPIPAEGKTVSVRVEGAGRTGLTASNCCSIAPSWHRRRRPATGSQPPSKPS